MPRRDMSYRKPAPIYVPSPQSSPAVGSVRPSFLKKAEREQARQSRNSVTREKPLPSIPAKEHGAQAVILQVTSARHRIEYAPAMQQVSKGCNSSTGALSTLNNCSDSETTAASCASRSTRRTRSQRNRQNYTLNQPYRPPTPPRQTESHRYSQGYATKILYKDQDRTRASPYNSYNGSVSQEACRWERHQVRGPRTSRVARAESVGTSPSYMTERSHFSFGASEGWSGGATVVAQEPVAHRICQKEKKEMVESCIAVGEYERIDHWSLWDRVGMWMHSIRARSKAVLRGSCW